MKLKVPMISLRYRFYFIALLLALCSVGSGCGDNSKVDSDQPSPKKKHFDQSLHLCTECKTIEDVQAFESGLESEPIQIGCKDYARSFHRFNPFYSEKCTGGQWGIDWNTGEFHFYLRKQPAYAVPNTLVAYYFKNTVDVNGVSVKRLDNILQKYFLWDPVLEDSLNLRTEQHEWQLKSWVDWKLVQRELVNDAIQLPIVDNHFWDSGMEKYPHRLFPFGDSLNCCQLQDRPLEELRLGIIFDICLNLNASNIYYQKRGGYPDKDPYRTPNFAIYLYFHRFKP